MRKARLAERLLALLHGAERFAGEPAVRTRCVTKGTHRPGFVPNAQPAIAGQSRISALESCIDQRSSNAMRFAALCPGRKSPGHATFMP